MRKIWLLTTLLIGSLLLAGCICNVNNDCTCGHPEKEEAKAICLENKWTYLWSTSPTEEHWECIFPSWVWCRDDMIINWECDWEADLSEIDTPEERQTWCENNVKQWIQDMIEWAVYYWIQWDGDEEEIKDEEWNLTMIVRNFYAKYDKDYQFWKLPWRCEANFIDGSNWTTYGEEFMVEDDYIQSSEVIKSNWEENDDSIDWNYDYDEMDKMFKCKDSWWYRNDLKKICYDNTIQTIETSQIVGIEE